MTKPTSTSPEFPQQATYTASTASESATSPTNTVPADESTEGQGSSRAADDAEASPEPVTGGFACPTCGRRFRRKNGLSRHMRSHTGEKPFACTSCKFRSTRTDSLQRHMKLHTNTKPARFTGNHRGWGHGQGIYPDGSSGSTYESSLPSYGYGSTHPYSSSREVRNQGTFPSRYPYHDSHPFGRNEHNVGVNLGSTSSLQSNLPGLATNSTFTLDQASGQRPISAILKRTTGAHSHSASSSISSHSGSPRSIHSSVDLGLSNTPAFTHQSTSSWPVPLRNQPDLTNPSTLKGLNSLSPSPLTNLTSLTTPASHHRAVWNAQQQNRGANSIIIPGNAAFPPPSAPAPGTVMGPPQIQVTTEGFPTTANFDFSRLFGSTLADESALGFDAYMTQAASLFSPLRATASGAENEDEPSYNTFINPPSQEQTSESNFPVPLPIEPIPPPPAPTEPPADSVPHSNRHLSQFVLNFNRHMPFVHVASIPKLFEDILDENGRTKTTPQAKQIDGLKPCTEDVLRAMAIVGSSYDGMLPSDNGFVPVPGSTLSAVEKNNVTEASPLTVDWYGASELKTKLMGDFADNPPSTVRLTFTSSGGPDSLFKDFLEEPTLLRRTQALALLSLVSLFSHSRAHQNHARLLHGALTTIARELLTETTQRQVVEKQMLDNNRVQLSEFEQWRQWARKMERRRTLWAIVVCDYLQSILFRARPFFQHSDLESLDLSDIGDTDLWEATSAEAWISLKAARLPTQIRRISLVPDRISHQSVLSLLFDTEVDQNLVASQISSLGTCGSFLASLSILCSVTETIRLDGLARQQIRAAAGLAPEPEGTLPTVALRNATATLAVFNPNERDDLLRKAQQVDSQLRGEQDRLMTALSRFRSHARVHVPQPEEGAAPWVEESASIICAAEALMHTIRSTLLPISQWSTAPDMALTQTLAYAPPPAPVRQAPDSTEQLLVEIRRALRSADPGASLRSWGVNVPIFFNSNNLQTRSFLPEDSSIDPTSFRGFFPRLS